MLLCDNNALIMAMVIAGEYIRSEVRLEPDRPRWENIR